MASARDPQYQDASSHSLVFRVMRLCRPAMHPDLLLRSALPDLFLPEDAHEEAFLAKSHSAKTQGGPAPSPSTPDSATGGAGPTAEDSAGGGPAAAGAGKGASSDHEAPSSQPGGSEATGAQGKAAPEGAAAGPPSASGAGTEGEAGSAAAPPFPSPATEPAGAASGAPGRSPQSQQQGGGLVPGTSVSVGGEDYFKARVELSEPLDSLGLAGMLVLPQSFGSIHLGETFCSYISVGNHANHDVSNVVIKAELQTERHRVVLVDGTSSPLERIQAGGRHDFIIEHDIKELGAHTLVCSASYIDFGEAKFLPQYFKFVASNPLSVKTKVRAVKEHMFMEASIENCGKLGLFLGRVRFEPVAPWRVTELKPDDGAGAGAEEDLEDDLCFEDSDSEAEQGERGWDGARGQDEQAEEAGASGGGGAGEEGRSGGEDGREARRAGGAHKGGHGRRTGDARKVGAGGRSRRQALVDEDSAYSAVFRKAQVLAPSGGTQHFLYCLTKTPPPDSTSATITSSDSSSGGRKSAGSSRGSSGEGAGTSGGGRGASGSSGGSAEERGSSQQQHEGGGTLGRLEISWRSTLGEPGRLQTQQILGNPVPWKEIEVKLKTLPPKVHLERPFLVDCMLVNHTDRTIGPLKIVIARDDPGSSGTSSSGVTSRAIVASGPWAMTVAPLEAHATHEFQLCLVALATGVQRLFGVGVVDARDSKPYDALPPTDLLVES